MTPLDQLPPSPIRAALRNWLLANHATSPGVLLVLGKAGGSATTLRRGVAVEALAARRVQFIRVAGKRDEGS